MVRIYSETQNESDSGIEETSEKVVDLRNGEFSIENAEKPIESQDGYENPEKQLELQERYDFAIKEGFNALAIVQNEDALESRSQTSDATSDEDLSSGSSSCEGDTAVVEATTPGLISKPGTRNDIRIVESDNFHVGDVVNNNVIVNVLDQKSNQESSQESIEKGQKKFVTIGKLVAGSVLTTLILVIIVVVVEITQLQNRSSGETPTYKIVGRAEWGALPSKSPIPDLTVRPPSFVIVGNTDGPTCSTFEGCTVLVKNIQVKHMSEGAADVRYNFLVGGDSTVYEGLGWDKAGNHTPGYNQRSIGVAFIGDFMVAEPPKSQVDAGARLLERGVAEGKLDAEYVVYVQKQVTPYESPGVKMIPFIKRWAHWSSYILATDCTWIR